MSIFKIFLKHPGFFLGIALSVAACKQPDTKIDKARQVVSHAMEEQHIVGLAISVIRDGEIVWNEGFGFADLENKTSVDPAATMFRVGSVSKAITATAAAILYEKGQLDLSKDVREYVPYFPSKKYPITVRHLAAHTSGIRHYNGDPREYYSRKRYNSVKESLTIFMDDSLHFKPGERWRYASFGFNTLSAVIEGASGKSFLSCLQDELFDPLGMEHTSADFNDSVIVGRSGHYEYDTIAGKIVNTAFVDNSYKWAGGGLLSSSLDLAKLGWAWHNNEIVGDSTRRLFISPQQLNDGSYTDYGLGWDLYDDLDVPSYGHGGTAVGGKGTIRIFPEYNMVIAIATNTWKIDYGNELNEIVKIFIAGP